MSSVSAHLGRVAFCFECSEEGFFGAEDLDGRRGVFTEVGETTCVTDQPSADTLSEESRQRGCDEIHFFGQIGDEGFAVIGDGDDTGGKGGDVEHVNVGDGRPHRTAGGIENVLCERCVVVDDGRHFGEFVL